MVSVSKLVNGGLYLAGQQVYQNLATPEQAAVDQYNIVRFLGGSAPYVQRQGYGISTDIPDGCSYEQVQLLSRHGERYPSKSSGKLYHKIYNKLKAYNQTFQGSLSFMNDYDYFVTDDNYYEKETTPLNSEGLFAGTTNAMKHGASFRSKYNSLFNENSTLPVFSSNSGRCFMTSKYFARGFLGDDYTEDSVKYSIIDEDGSMGANSLTPRSGCNTLKDAQKSESYDDDYLQDIVDRIQLENNGIDIDTDDVENLFGYCAYEMNVKGASPFCDIFTNEELVKFSYQTDVDAYYSNGPGNNMTLAAASQMVLSSLKLLKDNSSENKVWLSFTHDTDIEIFHASLGIINPSQDIPTDHIPFPNPYVHSSIVPQGSRTYTEKYKCGDDSYVRFILNDAVIPINSCSTGPGFSCKLEDFEDYINERFEGVSYEDQCQNSNALLTFYWDYNQKNYTAALLDS
ncbi:uncharacterized protein PRCAT00004586001 [Priceomyces carsonii]|uniref:uncharacterized protein n=1 Tax=Priceomyces carsonii TaxID=28549 RepID=UPI002ED93445|nr:unnamed protein product [Priceomyces carsonii]